MSRRSEEAAERTVESIGEGRKPPAMSKPHEDMLLGGEWNMTVSLRVSMNLFGACSLNERESTLVIRIHVHLPVDEILVECSSHILAAKEYSRT